jgi:hypothetical protein
MDLNTLLLIGFGVGLSWFIFFSGIPETIVKRIAPGIRAAFDRDYYNMLSRLSREAEQEISQYGENTPATTTLATDNNSIAMLQNERNELLLLGKAQALATLVQAKKINETDGILIVFGVKPSSTSQKYQAARKALRDELVKLQGPQFQRIDNNHQPVLKS